MSSVLYQDKHGCTEDYYTLTYSMPSVLYQDKHGCTEDYYTLTNSMPSVLYQDKHGCTENYYTLTNSMSVSTLSGQAWLYRRLLHFNLFKCHQYFIRINMAVQRIIIL